MEGIETIKKNMTLLAAIVIEWDNSLADKKIKPVEWARIGVKSLKLVEFVRTLKVLKRELQDIDGAEKHEIAEHFKTVFELRNDTAEAMIEELVTVAIGLSGVFTILESK